MSKNVEKLSLKTYDLTDHYSFPDFFYNNAYLKQLAVEVESRTIDLIPRCKVSWTSLRDLSLTYCKLSDDSFPKILSGCPMLESLTLRFIDSLKYLDLSEYKRLRRLDVDFKSSFTGPMEIVAPHIYYLRLRNFKAQCSLVDVSSLTEANLNAWYYSRDTEIDSLQVTVQSMLEKLYNVEELTLGVNFIQILSLAQLRGVHFPQFNIKILNLETRLSRSLVPGTVKILQSSPRLKKIVINITKWGSILEGLVNGYLASQELSLDQWWRSKLVAFPTYTSKRNPELVASLMELLLANTETLETLVVHYGSGFENLLEIARKLSHNSKVSIIVLK